MRKTGIRLGLAAACTLHGTGAMAQAPPPDPFNGYVQFMSNYVGRGLSQSVGEPSVQAELEYISPTGFYADLDGTSINWIDQVYPGDSVSLELDGLLGFRRSFARDWAWKAGVLRLQFPGHYVRQSPPVEEPHTTELFAYLSWKGLSAKLNYAVTNAFGTPDSRGSWYLDLSASQPVGRAWTLGAHLGRKQARGTDPATGRPNDRFSYTDWKLSADYAWRRDLIVTLAGTASDADPALYTLHGYNVGGRHLALTLKKTF